ncbi:MAG: hypothetical protein IJI36_14005 [Kiritimatiellae bacterium]|nr:hypothetical protein [Kiritimatiellia bacterium]
MDNDFLCKALSVVCMVGLVLSVNAASSESLAKYDKDPDGEIVSQRVTVATDDNGGDTIVKTITITREIRKGSKKNGGGSDDEKAEKKPEFPPPPVKDASEPKRLVRYFCRVWKDEDFKRMYGAMDPKYRRDTTFAAFKKLFESDAEMNAGLADENIAGGEGEEGASIELSVTLRFKNKRVNPRVVKALVIKTPDGFRMQASPIIPLDLDNF